jgi:hypothetical protein
MVDVFYEGRVESYGTALIKPRLGLSLVMNFTKIYGPS